MRNILVILFVLFCSTIGSQTVNAQKTADGWEYKAPPPKSKEDVIGDSVLTEGKYRDKDNARYDVYITEKLRLFYIKQNKSGAWRRYYIIAD